jgi:acetyl-CoA synthetase
VDVKNISAADHSGCLRNPDDENTARDKVCAPENAHPLAGGHTLNLTTTTCVTGQTFASVSRKKRGFKPLADFQRQANSWLDGRL